MLMIDDSRSMGAAGPVALHALTALATALQRLEIGQLGIASFAEGVRLLHPLGRAFSDESGASVGAAFTFAQDRTLLGKCLESMRGVLAEARAGAGGSAGGGTTVLQLCFVISDARIDSDNRAALEGTVRRLQEEHVLVVLVILDANADAKVRDCFGRLFPLVFLSPFFLLSFSLSVLFVAPILSPSLPLSRTQDSIFNTRSVEFRGDKVVTSAYLDDFPFPYYMALQVRASAHRRVFMFIDVSACNCIPSLTSFLFSLPSNLPPFPPLSAWTGCPMCCAPRSRAGSSSSTPSSPRREGTEDEKTEVWNVRKWRLELKLRGLDRGRARVS